MCCGNQLLARILSYHLSQNQFFTICFRFARLFTSSNKFTHLHTHTPSRISVAIRSLSKLFLASARHWNFRWKTVKEARSTFSVYMHGLTLLWLHVQWMRISHLKRTNVNSDGLRYRLWSEFQSALRKKGFRMLYHCDCTAMFLLFECIHHQNRC